VGLASFRVGDFLAYFQRSFGQASLLRWNTILPYFKLVELWDIVCSVLNAMCLIK
jgi:hypothetical protein